MPHTHISPHLPISPPISPGLGSLHADRLLPLLEAHGVEKRLLGKFKLGTPIELPTGELLQPSDFMDPPTSRRIGQLCDAARRAQ